MNRDDGIGFNRHGDTIVIHVSRTDERKRKRKRNSEMRRNRKEPSSTGGVERRGNDVRKRKDINWWLGVNPNITRL